MSRFFINRPIVAMVIAILTVIAGAITIVTLPVSQFPAIAPPEVQVQTTFVGADAQTVEESVATPIEQQMSGVDNLNYMYSVNSSTGESRLIVDFDVSTDPNTDLILAQLRQSQAASQLPPEVTSFGVTVQKTLTAPLMLISLYSPSGIYDSKFLANFAYINFNDQLTRVPGIGSVQVFGAGKYAMRLWVRPDQLAKLGITVPEIIAAINSQNTVNPAGQIGSEPAPQGQEFTYTVRAQGRLTTPEEFEQIVVRAAPAGGIVRVKDVARVELGAQDYTIVSHLNGKPSAIIAVYQLPGSNAVQAADGVKKLLAEQRPRLPQGVDFTIALDTTRAVSEGIKEIVLTLSIAIVLVIIVVYVFLQGWRATLIPLLAVPVSLVGTFALFPLFGFSINTLSLFGLVLAIGLVVDDAIVVVEAVEHHIEEGMSPKEATLKAMEEISGPVVGIALVLSAVFIPTAFIPGITGRLYQQFAVTIAISVLLSAFNALTLSPALSALLLRPRRDSKGLLRRFFDWFNRLFARATDRYLRIAGALIRKSAIAFVALVMCGLLAAFFGAKLPSSFLPDEDQGYMYLNLQPAEPHSVDLQRILLRDAEGMEGPPEAGRAVPVHTPEREPKARWPPAGHRVLVLSSGDPRGGDLGRIQFRARGSLGKGREFPRRQPGQVPGGSPEASGARLGQHHVPAEGPTAVRRGRQGQGAQAGGRDQGRLSDHPDLHGRGLHQLLQPIWPAVAGLRRGRRRLSRPRGERRAVLRP